MEASQLEIEEQLLEENTPEKTSIKVDEIEKKRDELFTNELARDTKKWQRQGANILLAKLGINYHESKQNEMPKRHRLIKLKKIKIIVDF